MINDHGYCKNVDLVPDDCQPKLTNLDCESPIVRIFYRHLV